MGTVNEHGHECWIVETSKDGERWRFFGKAWKQPGEQILLHAVPRYVRFRPEWEKDWREPLERTSDLPMTLPPVGGSVTTPKKGGSPQNYAVSRRSAESNRVLKLPSFANYWSVGETKKRSGRRPSWP